MFQFPRCSLVKLCIHFTIHGVTHVSFLIRRSPDLWLCAPTRSLSQLITSFIGSWCQGIHHAPFVAWPFACLLAPITASTAIFACSRTEVLLTAQIFCLLVLETTKLRKHFSILVNLVYFRHICFNQYHKEYLFLACCILYTLSMCNFQRTYSLYSCLRITSSSSCSMSSLTQVSSGHSAFDSSYCLPIAKLVERPSLSKLNRINTH